MQVQTRYEHLDDATLVKLQNELVDFASLQAKQHTEQSAQLSETQYRFGFWEVVGKKVQKVIYEKLSKTLAVSAMVTVAQLRKETAKKVETLIATKHFGEHQLLDITNNPNYEKRVVTDKPNMPKWMWVLLALLAIAEGYFVFQGMLLTGMGIATSVLTSICVATGILIGGHYAAIRIKKMLSKKARIMTTLIINTLIFIAFYALGNLRVDAIKATISRDVEHNNYAILPPNSLPITLAFISTFIFLLGFLSSYYYAKTAKEIVILGLLQKEQELELKNKEINAKIEVLNKETEEKSKAALEQYEKALLYLKQLKSIASIANTKYVATYINFKSGESLPAFLQKEPDFNFEDFIPKT